LEGSSTGSSRGSYLICNSATTAIVTLQGYQPALKNVYVERSVAGSSGASGVVLNGTEQANVSNVFCYDSPNCFLLENTPANTTIKDSWAVYTSISSGSVAQYGINENGPCNSSLLSNVVVVAPTFSGTSYGLYRHGTGIHDCFYDWFQASSTSYGVYIDGTGSTGGVNAADIHFSHPILDSCLTTCFYTTGVTSTGGAAVQIDGAWIYSNGVGIDLESSNGVNFQGAQVRSGSGTYSAAIYINGGGANLIRGITGSSSGTSPFIKLNSTTDNVLSGNSILGVSGNANTLIALTSATKNVISNNSLSGYATLGISADSGSSNNLNYPNVIDTTNITTAYSDSGSGNQWIAGITVSTITASSTPAIVASNGLQTITLNANSTPTISGIAAGQRITFQICQPASGGPYTWTWPSAVHGGMTIGTTASDCSVQSFDSFSGSTLVAESTGVINVAP
jgi:hypothetical protein